MQGDKQPDWEKIVRRMETLLRLKSFPVAFKMLDNKVDLEKIPFMRRAEHKVTLCQLITLVRDFDWTVGAQKQDFSNIECASILGFTDLPEIYKDGTVRSMLWTKSREDGKKFEESIQRLPLDKYEAVAIAPLVYNPFRPDIVLIYANPAQVMMLINALQFEAYEAMSFSCVGESSCSDAIARCYLTGKPSVTIPCYGERRYGHARDEDLVIAIPCDMMERALYGLETLYKRGIRYPVSYAGAELDLSASYPVVFKGLEEVEKIRGKDNRLLLGVTGGIASGKSTVANMLVDMGAYIIDFDVLSREIVEPGQPAWQDIVEYFGKQVLQKDKNLDRKKISDIVFRDIQKRKKLEGITHPRIIELFIGKIEEITSCDPDAVILVVSPLLIEFNSQYRCHKTLLVYVPREVQIERLMKRDNITEEKAEKILAAQMPIDEKIGYADFLIYNDKSLDETRRQVQALWAKLEVIRR
ncbi:MAG: dephospho-CoA kinase [Desulfatiglandales bacterium]